MTLLALWEGRGGGAVLTPTKRKKKKKRRKNNVHKSNIYILPHVYMRVVRARYIGKQHANVRSQRKLPEHVYYNENVFRVTTQFGTVQYVIAL